LMIWISFYSCKNTATLNRRASLIKAVAASPPPALWNLTVFYKAKCSQREFNAFFSHRKNTKVALFTSLEFLDNVTIHIRFASTVSKTELCLFTIWYRSRCVWSLVSILVYLVSVLHTGGLESPRGTREWKFNF